MHITFKRSALSVLAVALMVSAYWASAGEARADRSMFMPLLQIQKISGTCLVKRPKDEAFEVAVEDRVYPYGTVFSTKSGSEVIVAMSPVCSLKMGEDTVISIVDAPDGYMSDDKLLAVKAGDHEDDDSGDGEDADDDSSAGAEPEESTAPTMREPPKIVKLDLGRISFALTRPAPDEVFPIVLETPVAKFDHLQFNPEFILAKTADSYILRMRTMRGEVRLTGDQFWCNQIKRNCMVEITQTFDKFFTSFLDSRGDISVFTARGSADPTSVECRAGSRIKIWRRRASVSQRLAVSVMVADPEGRVTSTYAFLEGSEPIVGALANWSDSDIMSEHGGDGVSIIDGALTFGVGGGGESGPEDTGAPGAPGDAGDDPGWGSGDFGGGDDIFDDGFGGGSSTDDSDADAFSDFDDSGFDF